MFGNLGAPELILIFLIILLVFGANRIPEIARGIGNGIREFKDSAREITSQMDMDERKENRGHGRTREGEQIRQPRPPAQGTPTAREDAARKEDVMVNEPPPEPKRSAEPGEQQKRASSDEKS